MGRPEKSLLLGRRSRFCLGRRSGAGASRGAGRCGRRAGPRCRARTTRDAAASGRGATRCRTRARADIHAGRASAWADIDAGAALVDDRGAAFRLARDHMSARALGVFLFLFHDRVFLFLFHDRHRRRPVFRHRDMLPRTCARDDVRTGAGAHGEARSARAASARSRLTAAGRAGGAGLCRGPAAGRARARLGGGWPWVVLFDGSLVCAQATAPKLTVVASARIMILIFASCASPQANNAFVR